MAERAGAKRATVKRQPRVTSTQREADQAFIERHYEGVLDRFPSDALQRQMVRSLGRHFGNHYAQRIVAPPAPEPTRTQSDDDALDKVGFVREEGLNLRARPDQQARSLTTLKLGTRVHTFAEAHPTPSWTKVIVDGQTGYVFAPRIHYPPEALIARDPGLRMVRVQSGQTFWGLVHDVYGIRGNESSRDQNMDHFINAIRVVNKPEAFNVREDWRDKVGNFIIPGRDASDTFLKANTDLWIPSLGVAAAMDVGTGTLRGEATRLVKKFEQKLADFKAACKLSLDYMPEAVAMRAGETARDIVGGLLDFAVDAAKILGASTAVGAILGAFFGGVGAAPGATLGFEVGLMILELYGLAVLVEAVMSIAKSLVTELGLFIQLVWEANGDKDTIDAAAHTLADSVGILASAALVALAAYLMKKGAKALGETKFAKTIGETKLAKWLKARQQLGVDKSLGAGHATPWADMTAAERKAFQHSYSRHAAELGLPNWAQSKAPELQAQFNTRVAEIRLKAQKVTIAQKPYGEKGSGAAGASTTVRNFEYTDPSGTRWYYFERLSDGRFISAGKAR
jgi:hypothetical protein